MHFAASLVYESVVDPQKYYISNVSGLLSLLAAMRDGGCRRIVFSSAAAVYGDADGKTPPESYPCAPINPYGAKNADARPAIAQTLHLSALPPLTISIGGISPRLAASAQAVHVIRARNRPGLVKAVLAA